MESNHRKKVLMLATTAAMIEQFNKNNILILENMGYSVDVAGNWEIGNPITQEKLELFKKWINEHQGSWFHITGTRNPMDIKNNIRACQKVIKIIKEQHYEFIHCHTPVGAVIGRIAAHVTGVKIIYTAHGFHFFKGAPIQNWLLYYPVEKFLSHWTDILITINKEDYSRAKRKFYMKKLEYIPGVGVDVEHFSKHNVSKESKRKEMGIPSEAFVLLSVGEVNVNKNHQIILKAMAEVNNADIHYLIAGKGIEEKSLQHLAKKLGLEKKLHLLGFRTDIAELHEAADVFCFPSLREGLGLAAIEAMASGLPLITSNIHGIKDYSINGKTGYSCKRMDVHGFAEAICRIMKEDTGKYRQTNMEMARKYDNRYVNKVMENIYAEFEKV